MKNDFEPTPVVEKGETKSVQITAPSDAMASFASSLTDNFKEKFKVAEVNEKDDTAKKVEQPQPFRETENFLLRQLSNALDNTNARDVQQLLGILAEHPGSTRRVMDHLKNIFEKADATGNLRVGWEQGTDNNGRNFVRLQLTRPNENGGGETQIIIGSDGRNSAVSRPKGAPARVLDVDAALQEMRPGEGDARRQLSVKQELLRQATERQQQNRNR